MTGEATHPGQFRVGVDTGGTFTDFVILDQFSGDVVVFKVPSTRSNEAEGIVNGLRQYLEKIGHAGDSIAFFSHGTTVGTNAILEGTGSPTGLIVTTGFRGIYEVGEQMRGHGSVIYDLYFDKPKRLVAPRYTEEVSERVSVSGEVLIELDVDSVVRAIELFKMHGIESVAVCLLFSFRNPKHEQQISGIFSELAPDVNLSLSSAIAPEIREYYRMSTSIVNAYLNPMLKRYITALGQQLDTLGVERNQRYIIRSNGGVASFNVAAQTSVQTILSGPAAGVVTAQHVAESTEWPNLVTFDMGGTSTDVALIKDAKAVRRMGGKIHDLDVLVPMMDIHTVAAGGGTIAWVDEMGSLQVGPRSAGSVPGPACYGKGGHEPTVTDANVVLGILSGDQPLAGGALDLDLVAAQKTITESIAVPLGISLLDAARGIIEIVNVKMQEAIKVVSSNKGYDLRDFYLFAFGGAGPIHASQIAQEMGMKGVVIPPFPGVASALGLLLSDVQHDFVHSYLCDLNSLDPELTASIFAPLRERAIEMLIAEGFPLENIQIQYAMDLRYGGQGYELTVGLPRIPENEGDFVKLRKRFDEAHLQLTGHHAPDENVEAVNYRVSVIVRVPSTPISVSVDEKGSLDAAFLGNRDVYFKNTWETVPMYQRSKLGVGNSIIGPALILQDDSTTLLNPSQLLSVDTNGYLLVESSAQDS